MKLLLKTYLYGLIVLLLSISILGLGIIAYIGVIQTKTMIKAFIIVGYIVYIYLITKIIERVEIWLKIQTY